MRIGILGSGLVDGKLGTIFARAGHDVVFSYSTSERKLKRLAREAKAHAQAGTPREANLGADALLLAVHWSRVDDVLKQAGDLSGKVIISCSLPMNANDTALALAHTSCGAEALAKKVRKARSFPHSAPSRARSYSTSSPRSDGPAAGRASCTAATTRMRKRSRRR
jgi:8-hydroxy-5-deazaflavin:NADPH oxidoreductase